jgi:threonine/homoserine efflux transporter RhtA
MELADKADALTLGVDAAATIQAENSLEKMLAHQMAAAHTAAMEAQANALDLMQRFKPDRRRTARQRRRRRTGNGRGPGKVAQE